jgi:transcriptional regulator with XRE-family HTH domain
VDSQAVNGMLIENTLPVGRNASMDSDQVIGGRLRALRKHFGNGRENQERFARRFGAEKTAWSNYETGTRPVPVELADRLCRDLGISLDWIYRGNGVAMPVALLQKLQPSLRKRA